MRLRLTRMAVAAAFAAILPTAAPAQSPACRQISAELANLERAPAGEQAQRQAVGLRRQYQQMQSAILQYGCDQPGGLFAPQPPAQCTGFRAQANALAAQIVQLQSSGRQDRSREARHAQLSAAYANNGCDGDRRDVTASVGRGGGFFSRVFGDQIAQPTPAQEMPAQEMPQYATPTQPGPQDGENGAKPEQKAGGEPSGNGGRVPVCVRTCDGFFFPINYAGAEGQYNDLCRASCPGAAAELYWMPGGGSIDQAVSARGGSYSALPTALAYRRSLSDSCSCKSRSQAWGSVLQQAEALIKRKGDVIVTDESSIRMAQPAPSGLRGVRGGEDAPPAQAKAFGKIATSEIDPAEAPITERKARPAPPRTPAAGQPPPRP